MTIEIGSSKPQAIDFTLEGKDLFVRGLPLSLGLRLQSVADGSPIPAELLADIVATCVVDGKGKPVMTAEQVLEQDLEPMLKLFSEVSGVSLNVGDAEKN